MKITRSWILIAVIKALSGVYLSDKYKLLLCVAWLPPNLVLYGKNSF